MAAMWGIHNNRPELDLVANGFISIGWDEMGDLTQIGPDKDAMKAIVAAQYPTIKPGAIPVWAGTLLRFGNELKVGDLVVYPYKPDSTLNFGRIESDYFYDASAPSTGAAGRSPGSATVFLALSSVRVPYMRLVPP